MAPQLFGIEHILYLITTAALGSVSLLLAKKYLKEEGQQVKFLKICALLLLAAIITNRLSQVFRHSEPQWYLIIPDSFCGMTSLVTAIAVLFGKRNNNVYHFVWLLGLFGGISTAIYATFLDQNISFFYIPTISGLLHHSLCAFVIVGLLMFKQIDITYKKWYCTFFGFTSYMTLGAFMMQAFDMSDAYHIAEPLLSDTPLTAWVMAPMYVVGHALILLVVEIAKKKKNQEKSRKMN